VHERIQFITHQKKQILLVDFSNCPSSEVEKISRAVPDYVTTQPRGSVLVLSDFTGATLEQEAIRTMKEPQSSINSISRNPHSWADGIFPRYWGRS